MNQKPVKKFYKFVMHRNLILIMDILKRSGKVDGVQGSSINVGESRCWATKTIALHIIRAQSLPTSSEAFF